MPFERTGPTARRIAVIGGGISGLMAAHLLARDHAVVLFEAERRLGGHARTVMAGRHGNQPVDTGFIVFNKVNYPNLTRLFEALDVPIAQSDMSFGASVGGGWMEYGTTTNRAFLAQKRNVLRPRFWGMFRDMVHFNRNALSASREPDLTIGGLLEKLGTGAWFRDYYITPLSGAIWSTPTRGILDFPAEAMIRFFANHNLLGLSGQHQWFTVRGGSVEYVRRLAERLDRQGVEARLDAGVAAVRRTPGGVLVRTRGGEWELYDEVVLATHSDVTLRLLADATASEHAALGAIRYQPNEAVLHADPSAMPRRRAVWSSWNWSQAEGPRADRIDLTYWMNNLQPIPREDPLFVTLNTNRHIDERLIHDVTTFRHPVYDLAALQAQAQLRALNGRAGTWFAGAWMKNGFHEDGLASALDVVAGLRERLAQEALAA